MKIPKAIHQNWKLKKEWGDIDAIHRLSIKRKKKVSVKTIGNAFNTGRADEETMCLINEYYRLKKEAEEKLVKEALS